MWILLKVILQAIFLWNLVIGQLGEKDIPAVGGKVANLGQLPHAVVVLTKNGKCTGAIIHASWVLTAGHCVTNSNGYQIAKGDIKVLAGVINFKEPGPTTQERVAEKVVVHPSYSHMRLAKYDIALLQVTPFQLNNAVSVIPFSKKEWPQDSRMLNRNCTSAGWGMLAGRQVTSVLHLQQTTAKHGIDSCPCIHKGYILKRVVCLAAESTVGICFGDSGGALVCDGEIVGVAHMVMDKRSCSFFKTPDSTIRCESSYVFGIYMYTCPYLNWIKQYVPGVPSTPASCKASSLVNLSSVLQTILAVLIIHKIYESKL
ncbi:cationic trypsin-3-like [Lycorma delicatula]|uniref:cationic trypsin-3-like n=1 Tax=Lycorma delicatula TaxID=130591 RepID=UPI003F51A8FC